MLTIDDFNVPTSHPYGMLKGYEHANEKESNLVILLRGCLEAGELDATIETIHPHPAMVIDGLLERVEPKRYKLTIKSKGLLYAHYGKG